MLRSINNNFMQVLLDKKMSDLLKGEFWALTRYKAKPNIIKMQLRPQNKIYILHH